MNRVVHNWSSLSTAEQEALMSRPAVSDDSVIKSKVAEIIAAVRQDGDAALYEFAERFEGRKLASLKVSPQEFAEAEAKLGRADKKAIATAIGNVEKFHLAQVPVDIDMVIGPGIRCERRTISIDSVGLYVPAGSAPLPSTAIMLTVPAAIAQCPVRILCTPAGDDGNVNAATLFAAQRSGVTDVFKIGGAQAIAALAFGTETVPKVNKLFGPGNAWVTAAKSLVAQDPAGPAIDMTAGPSEVLVVADAMANAAFVAADLLSQAEHGVDSQVILVTTCLDVAELTVVELEKQLRSLTRKETAEAALANSHLILVDSLSAAMDISNRYAPEHLILQVESPRDLLPLVRNAGSVFVGKWTPESAGDYCSGTNHVLPTYGAAKSMGGLGVEQFMRQVTVQELTRDGLRSLSSTIEQMASLEGLDAHAKAVQLRLIEITQ